MARIDRMVYFDLEADADTYIAAIIGSGSTGTKILAAGAPTLVVATQPNKNADDGPGLEHRDAGLTTRGNMVARIIAGAT